MKLQMQVIELTLCLPNKLSYAKFLVCFNFQSASMSLKAGEKVSELLGVSSGCKLFAYGTLAVLCGLRVNNAYFSDRKYMMEI